MNTLQKRLVSQLGHNFRDPALLELALTHRSCGARNNERLEFLGDALVNFVIGEAIFKCLPQAREGDLSRIRASLVKGETLAEVAREMNLGEYLKLGAGEMKSGGHRRASILADAVEAIIGAIYLDAGMDTCQQCIHSWFASRLSNITLSDNEKDPKTRLQELMQAKGYKLPVYEVTETCGDPHNQQFTVSCQVEGLTRAVTGVASSRRAAEKAAALETLNLLQGNPDA